MNGPEVVVSSAISLIAVNAFFTPNIINSKIEYIPFAICLIALYLPSAITNFFNKPLIKSIIDGKPSSCTDAKSSRICLKPFTTATPTLCNFLRSNVAPRIALCDSHTNIIVS